MTLAKKVTLLLLLLFMGYGAVQLAVQRLVMYPSFVRLEEKQAGTNLGRALNALRRETELLGTSASGWSVWDDTYRFMADRNGDYREANLNADALESENLNFLGFFDPAGEPVWVHGLDLESGAELPAERLGLASLSAHPKLLAARAPDELVTGLLYTPLGPMMIASSAILTSARTGPARGVVVMGRLLDAAATARLGRQAEVRLTLGAPAAVLAPVAASDGVLHTPPRLQVQGDSTLSQTTVFDIERRPLFILRVDTPRDIAAQGQATIRYAIVSLGLAGFAVAVAMLLLLRKTVFEPLAQLTAHVTSVDATSDLAKEVGITSNDEVGALAREFETMMGRLAEARATLLDQSYKSGVAEMASGVLHNIGNALTPLSVKLASALDAQHNAPQAEVARAIAELADPATAPDRRADLTEFMVLATREFAGLAQRTAEDIAALQTHVQHIQAILADQQRWSRAERVVESIGVGSIVKDAIAMLPTAAREALTIDVTPAVRQAPPVHASRVALQQIVSNLLINAAEAMLEHRDRGHLRVDATVVDLDGASALALEIVDDGCGIAPEILPRLFEAGFSTKSRGSGLGLHWSANMAAAMGGRLAAHSAGAGHGAQLKLTLPLAARIDARLERAA